MAPKKPKYVFPLLEVKRKDAQTSHGWLTIDETIPAVPVVTTVGFLIKENDDSLCIASTIGTDFTNNARIDIPIGMVVERKVLA
jgi:hypothetical protein